MSTNTPDTLTREARFVRQVAGWSAKGRTASLAELRRSLARPPGQDPAALRNVLPLLDGIHHNDEWRYFLVAGLVALNPAPQAHVDGQGSDIGTALRSLAQITSADAVERRFIRLLDADPHQLAHHLRQTVQLINSHGVPWDAAQLLGDLRYWTHPDRFVQRRWARHYWAAQRSDTEN